MGADSRNFALVQDKNKLRLSLRTSATKEAGQTVDLCTLPDAKPYHLTVNYTNGILTCFINGKEAAKLDTVKGDLGNWEAAHLVFGDNWTASRNWPGTLEGVALFSRALSATEAAQDAETYTKKATRRVLPVLRVKGKLLAKSPVPSLQKIAPYYQSLVTYTYEVEKVIEGKYEEKNIRVAHWGLMEKKVLPEIADRKIDQSYEFELQPMNSNRQLESQWLEDTLETSDLPLFYDVTP